MKIRLPFVHRDIKKAIFFTLCGWLSFSLMYLVSKIVGPQSNVATMVFFRNVIGILAITPFIIRRFPKSLEVKSFRIIFIRAFSGLGNLIFLFLAIQKLSLVNATLLNNTAPFFVPFLLWLFLKAPVEKKVWPAIVVGFMGVALILRPDTIIFNLGSIYGILSGICLAITTISLRSVARSAHVTTYVFYFFLIGLIATTPFAIAYWEMPSLLILLGLLSIGLFSCLGQLFVYFGMREAKPEQIAPFSYSTVIFAGLFDWMLWGDIPPLLSFLGMALIILAGAWIALSSKPSSQNLSY
jgi:drug/metabolite transporter (DMT)-like permease